MADKRMQAEFAERLKLALDEAGFVGPAWPDKRLAREFEVTPQALRKWREGASMPTFSHAQLVATRLGVRRAWLIDGEVPMRAFQADLAELPPGYASQPDTLSLSADEFRLIRHFRSLPQGLQQRLLALIDELGEEQQGRRGSSE